jgi:hypothetical protein
MKFGSVEDNVPAMVFVYVLRKICPWAGLLRLENLSWPNRALKRKFDKIKVVGHTQLWVSVRKITF